MNQFPFSKKLFWDIDIITLDITQKKRFVIERVLVRGGMNDVKKLFQIFTRNEIIDTIKSCRDLDVVTHNFCHNYFNIPKEEMHAPSQYY